MAPTTMKAPRICSGETAWPSASQAMPSTAIGSKLRATVLAAPPSRGRMTNSEVIALP